MTKEAVIEESLDDTAVVHYLINDPKFFIRNAIHVDKIRVPHHVRGSVSLVEWQMSRQRKRINELEEEMVHLIEQATDNEILFNQLMGLQNELIMATSLEDLFERLQRWARFLGLAGVAVRLFPEKWLIGPPMNLSDLSLSMQQFEYFRMMKMRNDFQYLGRLDGQITQLLLPEKSFTGSVALSLLGKHHDLGIIMFMSRDKSHYEPGMGTFLLEHIALFLPYLIARWIPRR